MKLIVVPNLEQLQKLLTPQEQKKVFSLPEPIPFQFKVTVKNNAGRSRIYVQLCSVYQEQLNAVCFVSGAVKTDDKTQPYQLVLRNKIASDDRREKAAQFIR